LIIKAIKTIDEIKAVAEVEADTWGMRPGDTVPDHVLMAIAREGGVLIGAFEDQHLIGFTLGWLGTVDPENSQPASQQLKLVSHMTGVLASHRDKRVGYKLKLAQRDWALAQGLDQITWTYDPLESRNGYFNIHLLRCVCDTYLRNYYGEMSDQMNEGVQSDRFRVDWWISSQEVEHSHRDASDQPQSEKLSASKVTLSTKGINLPDEQVRSSGGFLLPPDDIELVDDTRVLIEIPSDYQAIRQADLDLAVAWRLSTRQVFEGYFSRGYKVVDFVYQKPPKPRSFYVLEQTDED
jgi:predicted GNAT superfamily acetyltransferase